MNHTQAIREIMLLRGKTLVELGARLGMTHVGVLHRITTKTGPLDTNLQVIETLGYEVIVRPRAEGHRPEGEYTLRLCDYPDKEGKAAL